MEWQDPPLMSAREYRQREGLTARLIYRPEGKETHYGRDTYADPFNVNADN